MGEVSLLIRSAIARSFLNLDSSRCRNPSLDKRKEGWTEVWGDNSKECDSSTWREEETAISRQLATLHPQLPLTLVQHRPAWFEQLVLRIAGIPHVVVNSPYAATEATGPLPYIKDYQPAKPPVVVGRNHPGVEQHQTSSILEYLQTERNVDLDYGQVTTAQQQSQAYLVTTLVKSQLDPILASLRFGDDDAWRQVYRRQYVEAACNGGADSSTGGYLPRLFGWFQAWSVRNLALRHLSTSWTVEEAVALARKSYASLETLLEDNDEYLLETTQPTMADAFVWAHLADALCDVHLVTVLADFPKLIQFFQRIYDRYFRMSPDDTALSIEDWRAWNHQENLRNSFQQIPLELTLPQKKKPSQFRDALELMQTLSVHTRDLQEVLTIAKEKRLQQDSYKKRQRNPNQQKTWYRWRMGGDIYPPKDDESAETTAAETPQQKKWRKDNKHNDELWLSGVIAGSILALIFARQAT